MEIGDIYKKIESNWQVKIVYQTHIEVCVEDLKSCKGFKIKFLSVFCKDYFLREFELLTTKEQ